MSDIISISTVIKAWSNKTMNMLSHLIDAIIWCNDVLINLDEMTSHKLFFQESFCHFYGFLQIHIKVCFFSSKLSQCLVLSAISIFKDLTLALISDPPPPTHHSHHPLAGRVLCSFWENLPKSYLAPPGGLASPPADNPGTAPALPISWL